MSTAKNMVPLGVHCLRHYCCAIAYAEVCWLRQHTMLICSSDMLLACMGSIWPLLSFITSSTVICYAHPER
jgi:hypothetical protein